MCSHWRGDRKKESEKAPSPTGGTAMMQYPLLHSPLESCMHTHTYIHTCTHAQMPGVPFKMPSPRPRIGHVGSSALTTVPPVGPRRRSGGTGVTLCICYALRSRKWLPFYCKWKPVAASRPGGSQTRSRGGLARHCASAASWAIRSLASCMMDGISEPVSVTWVPNKNIFLSFPTSDSASASWISVM